MMLLKNDSNGFVKGREFSSQLLNFFRLGFGFNQKGSNTFLSFVLPTLQYLGSRTPEGSVLLGGLQ